MWPFKKKSEVKRVEQEIKFRIVPTLKKFPKKARDVSVTFINNPEVINTTIYGDYDSNANLSLVDLRTGEASIYMESNNFFKFMLVGDPFMFDPQLESVNGEYRFVINGSEYRYPLTSIKRVTLGPVYDSNEMVEILKDTLELIEKEEK